MEVEIIGPGEKESVEQIVIESEVGKESGMSKTQCGKTKVLRDIEGEISRT